MSFYKHETAIVESTSIGEGTRIWHFAHVRQSAQIGKDCNIGKSVYIDSDAVINNRVKIQNFVSVYRGVTIEDDVFVGPAVTFTNDLYPRAAHWNEEDLVSTVVRKGASIGANSTIICGVEIGTFAMVGAGSVVTKDIPPFGLVLGNPARLKGYVCYCGRKLEKGIKIDKKKIVYACKHCGEKVEIIKP